MAGLLRDLRAAAAEHASVAGGAGSGSAGAEAQRRIDTAIADIDRIAATGNLETAALLAARPGGFSVEDVSGELERFGVGSAAGKPGSSLDVVLDVRASAQAGGLFLSFGNGQLDLSTSQSQFRIEVTGVRGERSLSFSSGTSVHSIAAAINTFTPVTGVEATASGTGVRIDSRLHGSAEFVSVRVVDDGGIVPSDAGVYGLQAEDAGAADAASGRLFARLDGGPALTDTGQDVAGFINGHPLKSYGAFVWSVTDTLAVAMRLRTGPPQTPGAVNAQTLGAAAVMRLVFDEAGAFTPSLDISA